MPLLESRLDGSVVKSSGSLSRYLNQCQPMQFFDSSSASVSHGAAPPSAARYGPPRPKYPGRPQRRTGDESSPRQSRNSTSFSITSTIGKPRHRRPHRIQRPRRRRRRHSSLSLYVQRRAYGDGLNHHEGDALARDDAPELYTRNKAMSERALFRVHQCVGLPVVTLPAFCLRPRQQSLSRSFRLGPSARQPQNHPARRRRLAQFIYARIGQGLSQSNG